MVKIWILERFTTIARMEQTLEHLREIERTAQTDEQRATFHESVATYEKTIEAHRADGGWWNGCVGKFDYQQFCREARVTMRRLNDLMRENGHDAAQFRVLQASIEDETRSFWIGNYIDGVTIEPVLQYLFATLYE